MHWIQPAYNEIIICDKHARSHTPPSVRTRRTPSARRDVGGGGGEGAVGGLNFRGDVLKREFVKLGLLKPIA